MINHIETGPNNLIEQPFLVSESPPFALLLYFQLRLPLNHYFAFLVVLTFITNAPRLNNMYFIINGFVFLHKSDLIPFIVELSASHEATAVISLHVISHKTQYVFISKHINQISLLFLLGETNRLQGACVYGTSKQPFHNSVRTA